MPRGKGKQKLSTNPQFDDLFKKVIGSLCEVKQLSLVTQHNVEKIFSNADTREELLKDIQFEVVTEFRLNPDLKVNRILMPPRQTITKGSVNKLPPFSPGTLYRIVAISGSHELFYLNSAKKLLGNEAIFLPQGHAVKITPQHGEFTYDNKSIYDKEKYPGRGFKRPDKRHLLIFDFITEDEEELKKQTGEDFTEAGKRLAHNLAGPEAAATANPGLIQNLLKTIGLA